jgi:hypothetical protein
MKGTLFNWLKLIEVLYYWTSGTHLDTPHQGKNVFWCAANTTSNVSNAFHRGGGSNKCVAFERWTNKFKILNCSKMLSFICEVRFSMCL